MPGKPQEGNVGLPALPTEWPPEPGIVARIVAGAVVATVAAAVTTKLFGRKAGLLGFLLATAAHEIADAPLARVLSELGL
jgi:hypothetical protein